ncbi:MAG: hypothetical protein UR69_C0001G0277 [Candidatus Moranbacteria bacterium GW2011_GWE2_35_2-]|nr:MAG: hypothetical protein UR69_C0001G0277 [Candidatus Moranbacteria bacterium GW2011_GWE2_35_2-]KKQ21806.1 MAG: hypothetical protein US37_C0007G0004 [Candidatus Moranbacteria bacterium GW2011_GWF2_37_11]KKQ28879.1 MAG: hypothetical protein US44_C0005G0021 [Candidatus Moranbacteria bacterium GW2011_GWD1_37_17]KKQ31044.1 MAG: hypothetical protein US47_C0001G0277 [Candidatus Moranbacteria bacterium GW2011_GWE1_37_24]KKQ48107.1 MAG: hypothetical protein US66_C0002G0051 [Candidatus Moranbacteria 
MPKDNLHYFEISKDNPEPHLDESYFVIDNHPKLKEHIKAIKEIKEILITIKKLQENKEDIVVIEKYFKKLFEVFNSTYANCSELGCFVNACDTTRDLIQKDFNSFKEITKLYIKSRKINDKVPESWVQAILDSNSSRKKGELGERKLVKILTEKGFIEVKSWEELHRKKKCVARFSREVFSNSSLKDNFGIKIKAKKQGKMLDLIIKDGKKIFLLEAKHLNVGGGEQDKQVSELIEILNLKEGRNDFCYISFLDGTYSNRLLGEIQKRSKKMLKQRKEIEKFLKNNKRNFWVNTAGFVEFVNDIKK